MESKKVEVDLEQRLKGQGEIVQHEMEQVRFYQQKGYKIVALASQTIGEYQVFAIGYVPSYFSGTLDSEKMMHVVAGVWHYTESGWSYWGENRYAISLGLAEQFPFIQIRGPLREDLDREHKSYFEIYNADEKGEDLESRRIHIHRNPYA